MTGTRWWAAVALAAAVTLGAPCARADDVLAPPWRGEEGATYQMTDFHPGQVPEWESVDNPYGEPEIWMYGDVWQWEDEYAGRTDLIGWGSMRNGFSIIIPNNPDENKEKRVWIQVTYYPDEGFGPPASYEVAGMEVGGGHWGPDLPSLVDRVTHADGWVTDVAEIVIQPNPAEEFIGIMWNGPAKVDQLLVETICVPEPATLVLLAAGGLGMLLRRR